MLQPRGRDSHGTDVGKTVPTICSGRKKGAEDTGDVVPTGLQLGNHCLGLFFFVWDSIMPHLLSPDSIPLLWGFHLGKLPLLVSASNSVGSATAYREASLGAWVSCLSRGGETATPALCPAEPHAGLRV